MKNKTARLEAIEAHLAGGDVRLTMPDGSVRTVSSRRWLDMMRELGQGIVAEDTKAVIDSVSDNCLETGNGRMTEVIKVMAYAEDHQGEGEENGIIDSVETKIEGRYLQ